MLSAGTVRDVLLAENAAEYLLVYAKDVVYCVGNGTDAILLSAEGREELERVNEEVRGVDAAGFFGRGYEEVVRVIAKDLGVGEVEAALRFFWSVGRRIEYEHRPETHRHCWYETGIESTNFLMDVCNHICGFGKLNRSLYEAHFNPPSIDITEPSPAPAPPKATRLPPRVDVGMLLLNL